MNQMGAGWSVLAQKVTDHLASLKQCHRLRELSPQTPEISSPLVAGHLDLTHNDYLGLRVNPTFHRRAVDAVSFLPPGAGASRLLGGEHPIFSQLESAFSEFIGTEASLFFNSGFAANEAVATCLAMEGIEFFSDELNHASIIDGLRLARISKHQRHIYPHLDITALESMLNHSRADVNIIYTESVFSMDGDVAPLDQLYDLCQIYRGVLVVDEAHAIGIAGRNGRGLVDKLLPPNSQLICIHTCGKALGVQGAFVSGPVWFRELLINKARSFIYSTAPSPWSAAAVLESLSMVRLMESERAHLKQIAADLRENLRASGINIGGSVTQIIPVIIGSELSALNLQVSLVSQGILTKAIRPPTVPEGSCRIRLSLNSMLTREHIDFVVTTLKGLICA